MGKQMHFMTLAPSLQHSPFAGNQAEKISFGSNSDYKSSAFLSCGRFCGCCCCGDIFFSFFVPLKKGREGKGNFTTAWMVLPHGDYLREPNILSSSLNPGLFLLPVMGGKVQYYKYLESANISSPIPLGKLSFLIFSCVSRLYVHYSTLYEKH
jgi:hypothetical protein